MDNESWVAGPPDERPEPDEYGDDRDYTRWREEQWDDEPEEEVEDEATE